MRIILISALLCLPFAARASTVISATLSITNSAALTNATSGQKYTLNGDARTFTNSVAFANAGAQIRVRTNDTAQAILLSLAAQAGSYPFADIQSITTSGGTNITFRATNDIALTITLSPTNWGRVVYSTQTVGVVQAIVRVPMSADAATNRVTTASQLWSDLDANSTNRSLGRVDFTAGLGLHGLGLVATNYTLTTNDLYLGVDTRSNTNLILTLPSAASASNLLFFIKDEGGAAATNTIKIYPQSGERIDTLLTNLVIGNNFGGVMLRSRGSTNWNVIASGGGVSGGFGGGGISGVALTNSVWVAKSGSDSTGARGDVSKAYLTLRAANTNATSGDTIFVMPGNYDEAGIVLKNGVIWNFAPGAQVVNTTNGAPIFSDAANVKSRITGSGVFTNAAAGGYEVLYQSGTNSDIYFECLRASGGHASDFYATIRSEAGALRVHGGVIVGWHYPAVLLSGTATAYFDGATLDATLNDQTSLGSGLVTAATNVVTLRNCTVLGSDDGSWEPTAIYSVHATSAKTVFIEGTLSANLPPNPNITYANVSYAGSGVENLAGNVYITGNLSGSGTNSASYLVGTNSVSGGVLILSGTTNQIVFGATNSAPASTNVAQWTSVQVSGLTNQFRLPLYQ